MDIEVLIKQTADGVIWPEREARAWIQRSELNSQAILVAQETLDDRIIDCSIVNLLRSVLCSGWSFALLEVCCCSITPIRVSAPVGAAGSWAWENPRSTALANTATTTTCKRQRNKSHLALFATIICRRCDAVVA